MASRLRGVKLGVCTEDTHSIFCHRPELDTQGPVSNGTGKSRGAHSHTGTPSASGRPRHWHLQWDGAPRYRAELETGQNRRHRGDPLP